VSAGSGGSILALARRALADSRTRTLSFAAFFVLMAYATVAGYRHSYPALADRAGFAKAFGPNRAVRLFYGEPHDLLSVGGYAAWRVGGVMAIAAGAWGLLAAVRALRAEEESGRLELVLAGTVTRRRAFLAALAAIGAGAVGLWAALLAGLVAAGLPFGGSAYLALAAVSPIPVYAGAGALASQLAATRRLALELATAALAIGFVLRVVADTSANLGALRWITPLGWAEELRPFSDPRPAVLALPLLAAGALLVAAGAIAVRRDVGAGLLTTRDIAAPRLRLLASPSGQALRDERASLAGWLVAVGFFALIVGSLSTSFSTAGISPTLQRQLQQVAGASIVTPAGALGFYFLFFVLALSLFGCAQIAAARREEAGQRLETLFALPVGRSRWLLGRLVLAAAATATLALTAGVLAWAGAAAQHAGVSLPRLLAAAGNCLPAALLFLALAALAFAAVPRASGGIAYGLVSAAFLWELLGSLLGAPAWTLALSPFHHVALVPAQAFEATPAVVMLAVAVAAVLAALWLLERRDLNGA
jgi:ABC-2 type transport system permease protein